MSISTKKIARVAVNSPLPQLDRLFDYEIPENLAELVSPGIRVKVPFGRSVNTLEGFVVELIDNSDFSGKLNSISEVISTAQVLTPEMYKLARAVADRQATPVSEVFRIALPDRSVNLEKKWLLENPANRDSKRTGNSRRITSLIRPVVTAAGPEWVRHISEQVAKSLAEGLSSIVIVPDFRDQAILLDALKTTEANSSIIDYSSSQTKSKRYASFLTCLSQEVSIVVGSRAAVFAPVNNLGQIIIWDDGDQSHQEQSSPYSHSREVALQRQQLQQCDVFLYGHSRSTEVARFIKIGFFEDQTAAFPLPKVANSETDIRVDSMAWRAIRAGLESGPVLVQVANKGFSTSIFCATCDQRAMCKRCNGPLWIDGRNQTRCRWCNAGNFDFRCQFCNATKSKQGSAGSSRSVAEFGKAFPGIRIIEATGEDPVISINSERALVISTFGAEPYAPNGYAAVVILDANRALSKDSLRATEDAIRGWANAIAKLSTSGQAVLVGVSGTLANKVSLWSMAEIAEHEYTTRAELRYPPAVRMASVGAERALLEALIPELEALPGVEILGPISISDRGQETELRLLLKYEYSNGTELARQLKSQALKFSAGQQRFSARSGRAMRPIRIKMDDVEVI